MKPALPADPRGCYPTRSRKASFASGMRSNSPETMPAMVDWEGIGRVRARLLRNFSSFS